MVTITQRREYHVIPEILVSAISVSPGMKSVRVAGEVIQIQVLVQ